MSVTSSRQTPSSRNFKNSSRRPRARQGGIGLKAIVAVCLAATGWVAYNGWGKTASLDAYRGVLTIPVHRGDLLITVLEDGNLESAKNLDIKCQVPGSLTILEIVPDGGHVQ